MTTLQDEIDQRSREIHTDDYSMSINEMAAMYSDEELEVHPEFQRIFRWTVEQQSRLVESVLLGIPVPPIFVAQRKDGVWDVIDGVQRLSTLLRFIGVLKDVDGNQDAPVPLSEGDYLKGLAGLVWDKNVEGGKHCLDDVQRRVFKRARLDFQIVQKESDEQARFDLFQRLNSGTRLSEQEARNCLAVMLDPTFSSWIEELTQYPSYETTVDLSDRQEQEAYDAESALRYLACVNTPDQELRQMGDVGEFLTNRMKQFITDEAFDREAQFELFKFVFDTISDSLGESAFKRYDTHTGRFGGKFSISAFEAIASGLARNYEAWTKLSPAVRKNRLRDSAIAIWNDEVFRTRAGGGKPANRRIPFMVELGERVFAEQAALQ